MELNESQSLPYFYDEVLEIVDQKKKKTNSKDRLIDRDIFNKKQEIKQFNGDLAEKIVLDYER
jgi:hypothetical protein